MSADLHIHIMQDITLEQLKGFYRNHLGHKWFAGFHALKPGSSFEENLPVIETPNVWIGEVSWLKAGLFEGGENDYVPNVVGEIKDLVDDGVTVITDEFIEKVRAAFELPNTTQYKVSTADSVCAFLNMYKGQTIFTISH